MHPMQFVVLLIGLVTSVVQCLVSVYLVKLMNCCCSDVCVWVPRCMNTNWKRMFMNLEMSRRGNLRNVMIFICKMLLCL